MERTAPNQNLTMNIDATHSSTTTPTTVMSLTHRADLRPQESLPLRHDDYAPRRPTTTASIDNPHSARVISRDITKSNMDAVDESNAALYHDDSLKKQNMIVIKPTPEVLTKETNIDEEPKTNPAIIPPASDHSSSVGSSSSSSIAKKQARRKKSKVVVAELKQKTAKTKVYKERGREKKSSVVAEIKIVSQTFMGGAPYYSKKSLQKKARIVAELRRETAVKQTGREKKSIVVAEIKQHAATKLQDHENRVVSQITKSRSSTMRPLEFLPMSNRLVSCVREMQQEQGELHQCAQVQAEQQHEGLVDNQDKVAVSEDVLAKFYETVGRIASSIETSGNNSGDDKTTSPYEAPCHISSMRPGMIRGLSFDTIREEDNTNIVDKDDNAELQDDHNVSEQQPSPKQEELNVSTSSSSSRRQRDIGSSSSHHTSSSVNSYSSKSTSSDPKAARAQNNLKSPKQRHSRLLGDIQKQKELQQRHLQQQDVEPTIPSPPDAAVDSTEVETKQPSIPKVVMTHPLAKKAANSVLEKRKEQQEQEHDTSKETGLKSPQKRESRILTCLKKQLEKQEQLKQHHHQKKLLQQQEHDNSCIVNNDEPKSPIAMTTTREQESTSCSTLLSSLASPPLLPPGTPSWAGTVVLKSPKKPQSRILGHFIKQQQQQEEQP
jgi:hypothetical protein